VQDGAHQEEAEQEDVPIAEVTLEKDGEICPKLK
jgi:hypothetical protein